MPRRRWELILLLVSAIGFIGIYLSNDRFIATTTIRTSTLVRETNQQHANVSSYYDIAYTNYGWMRKFDSKLYPRRQWERNLYDAILQHERYRGTTGFLHPQGRPTLVFLDRSTCAEHNWPHYAPKHGLKPNMDTQGGRRQRNPTLFGITNVDWKSACRYIEKALMYMKRHHPPQSRLLIPHCHGWCTVTAGYHDGDVCQPICHDSLLMNRSQLMVAYQSRPQKSLGPNDIGLPPPAVHPYDDDDKEEDPCKRNRSLTFLFQGSKSSAVRVNLMNQLSNLSTARDYHIQWTKRSSSSQENNNNNNYPSLLHKTHFAAAPRGDALYSYRFSEILSHATIPVVLANDWALPFSTGVVNWTSVALVLQEEDVSQIPTRIGQISDLQKCEMQQNAKWVWDSYMRNHEKILNGLVESFLHQVGLLL